MSNDTLALSVSLEPTSCGLCGSDEAEPVAVGEDFRSHLNRETYLAVRCSSCGLIYLTRVPTGRGFETFQRAGDSISGPLGRTTQGSVGRRVSRWATGLAGDGLLVVVVPSERSVVPPRVVAVGAVLRTPTALAASPPETARGALLVGTLEQLVSPVETLRELRRVLRPDGRVLVIAVNPGSLAGVLFRGRHWSGYDFPRRRNITDATALCRLASAAGFEVASLTTAGDPGAWTESVSFLLRDWGASPRLARLCTSLPFTVISRVLEGLLSLMGKGGLLQANLRPHPVESPRHG